MRYSILNDAIPASLIYAAAEDWPDSRWPWWMAYADEHAVKRASRGRDGVPYSCLRLLDRMAEIDVSSILGLPPSFPDFSLHGAGLHEIPPGGWLSRHLDSSHHPTLGWTRAASVVLFLNERWEDNWGGELVVGEDAIAPKRGRVVLMASTDDSFHAVRKVTGPEARKTLAMFWWNRTESEAKRPKAEFV